MKKKLLIGITSLGLLAVGLTGCGNMQIIDTTWSFEKAIIYLPNGEIIEGEVESWTDFEDGDQVQIKIDGKQYLTHMSNVILISE